MSDEVSMDEAVNTALLLEQHMQKKMATAIAEFLFADYPMIRSTVQKAIDGENMPFASMTTVNELSLQIVHSSAFQNNLNYLVKNVIREEMTELRQMVRDEFSRGIVHNTYNANRTG